MGCGGSVIVVFGGLDFPYICIYTWANRGGERDDSIYCLFDPSGSEIQQIPINAILRLKDWTELIRSHWQLMPHVPSH